MKKLLTVALILLAGSISTQLTAQSKPPKLVPLDEKQAADLLSSLKGKVVLVNFWATWCKPCVIEFPHLVNLQRVYGKRGVKVVFISVDEMEDAEQFVRPFLKKQNVTFPTYIKSIADDERFINAIGSGWRGAIPTTFIYDRTGKQVSALIGARDFAAFEQLIKPLLE